VFNKKYKLVVLFIVMLLVFGLILPACMSQKSTGTEVPQAQPEQQDEAEGEVAAVEQQNGTEGTSAQPEQRVVLSFAAAEYVNTDVGFAVKYPEEWLEQPIEESTTVFYVAAAKRVPALSIYVLGGDSFEEAVIAALSGSGSNIRVVNERTTTLQDGTPASEGLVKWEVEGFGANTFALGAQKDDKWIILAITTVSLLAKYDEAKFSEIAHTLEFK
jgi:hypothetical protein